jgi:hypothetical protein
LRGQRREIIVAAQDRLRRPGQAEVQQLRPRLGQHHVAGLEVPVDHTVPVGLVQGVRDLGGVAQGLVQGQGTLLEPVVQRLALQVLQDEVVGAVLVSDVVEDADVGMVQRRNGLGLTLEAQAQVGVLGEMLGQHLDGHGAVEAGVPRPVHLAHPPGPQGAEDLVGTQAGTRTQGHAAVGSRRFSIRPPVAQPAEPRPTDSES